MPPAGIALALVKPVSDWLQGYCYQFWRCRHNAFRGDGAFGQFAIVMPEQEAVLAITSETSDAQGELDLVWEHLLPAMKDSPLPGDKAAQTRLRQALGALALPLPQGRPAAPLARKISGQTFKIEANANPAGVQTVWFRFEPAACTSP